MALMSPVSLPELIAVALPLAPNVSAVMPPVLLPE